MKNIIIMILYDYKIVGVGGSVLVKALRFKPEGRGFKSRWGGFFTGPGVDSASNRNEYQES
jgi:hypothetical protein